ncbi:MAG: DUF1643 domain-containing protein [Marmoricola sp.]
MTPYTTKSASFSSDRLYRYALIREWGTTIPAVTFIGLNPSTADASKDDPTIRRCVRFAQEWGFRRLTMLNLFAYRSTNPAALRRVDDPVGEENDAIIGRLCGGSGLTIMAWGAHPLAKARAPQVVEDLLGRGVSLAVLGLTKDGAPRHPLYMRASAVPLNPLTLEPVEIPANQ